MVLIGASSLLLHTMHTKHPTTASEVVIRHTYSLRAHSGLSLIPADAISND
jgi:hypothetical protein